MSFKVQMIGASVLALLGSSLTANATPWLKDRENGQQPLPPDQSSHKKNPFNKEFASFVHEILDEWHVAGVSIAVVDGDDVFAEGYGFATLPDTPATPETLWYTGSTTKAFTAATLARMINSGEYPELAQGWQTPISSIIRDDFVLQDEWATSHTTLEDAACHRSGQSSNDIGVRRNWTHKDIVRNMREFPLNNPPRTKFEYNNEMYAALSHVIETLTGKKLGQLFKESLWGPMGMNSTYLDLEEALEGPEHLSRGYFWNETLEEQVALPFLPTEVIGGAGATISSVLDYTKWMRCLLRKGDCLPQAVHEDLRTPRFVENPTPALGMDVSLYGLAWWRTTILGNVLYWHSGSTNTHGTLLYWLPDLDYGVVIMANYATMARQVLMRRLIEDKLAVPQKDRLDIDKILHEAQRQLQQALENADDILYPDRPKSPLPPTVSIEELAGNYTADGLGTYTFAVEADDEVAGGKVLAAWRPDLLWQMHVKLRHVSGNYWILTFADVGGQSMGITAAEFKIGVDGKVSGLDVSFTPPGAPSPWSLFMERE